jgi:aldehyde dehydrogenase (NAD+)
MSSPFNQQNLICHPDRFFLGGEWISPSAATKFEIRDSGTEEIFLTVAEAQQPDIERAGIAARRAFDSGPWPRMSGDLA